MIMKEIVYIQCILDGGYFLMGDMNENYMG